MRALQAIPERLAASATTASTDEERLQGGARRSPRRCRRRNTFAPACRRRTRGARRVLKFGPIEAIKASYRDEQGLPAVRRFLARRAVYASGSSGRPRCSRSRRRFAGARASAPTPPCSRSSSECCCGRCRLEAARARLCDRRTDPDPVQPAVLLSVLHGPAGQQCSRTAWRRASALPLNVTVNGQTVRASGELVSGNYFGVLGASTQIGPSLLPEDDSTPGAHPVAVISDRFWRRTFASDPAIVGRRVPLNDQTFTIVGVAGQRLYGHRCRPARRHLDPVGHAARGRPESLDRGPHELARDDRPPALRT